MAKKTERLPWMPIRDMAEMVVNAYLKAPGEHAKKLDAAARALELAGLGMDRRVNRLVEKVKDAVCWGGLKDVTQIRKLLRQAFKIETIRAVDENGEPLKTKPVKVRKPKRGDPIVVHGKKLKRGE
jgi:hypothetical protein